MNIKNILSGVLDIAGSITGIGILKEASKALSDSDISPEQQTQIQNALMKHEEVMAQIDIQARQQANEEMKTFITESVAEINSSDRYTSRARPTGVYCAILITIGLAFAVVWCMIYNIPIEVGAIGEITSLIVPLWGSAAYYTQKRTEEKVAMTK